MKTIRASIEVRADDGVTPQMLWAILVNHLYWAMHETEGGNIRWDTVKVFCGDGKALEPQQ